MACCCKTGNSQKSNTSCLGRCDLPRHKCVYRLFPKRGPVPKNMGWLYTAKDSPKHQLRCGWRPGHIFCPVLRKIEQHNCMRSECFSCPSSSCVRPTCVAKPCCGPLRCAAVPSCTSTCSNVIKPPPGPALIRIVRHAGQYTICTKPESVCNAPSAEYPLKYVLDTNDPAPADTKFSIEAKFNEYQFDYTSSQASFVLDFSPPEARCCKSVKTVETENNDAKE